MRRIIFIFFLLSVIPGGFQSCTRTPCIKGNLLFQLISFSDAESNSVILRRYNKGQNFSMLKDTTILQISFRRSNDTLLQTSSSTPGLITSDYDHELYFPVANKTYRITEIIEEQSEIKQSLFHNTKQGCENVITSLKINNIQATTSLFNYIYIHK